VKRVNGFRIFEEMGKRNDQEFRAFTSNNIMEMQTGSSGWGFVKIAIPNSLIMENTVKDLGLGWVLLTWNKDTFSKIEEEIEGELKK